MHIYNINIRLKEPVNKNITNTYQYFPCVDYFWLLINVFKLAF